MFRLKGKSERKYKGSVLIVDHIELRGNALDEILRRMSYRVEFVSSYEEAKTILSNAIFDVTVIEPQLNSNDPSNMDGMRLIALISNTQRSKNIIIYTAFPTIDLVRDVFKYKILDFIDKKESPDHAIAAIEKAVSTPSALGGFPHLTIPEHEVLELIAKGKSDHEISKETNRPKYMVNENVESIMAKLRAENRAQIIERAERIYLVVRDNTVLSSLDNSVVNSKLPIQSSPMKIETTASTEYHHKKINSERQSANSSKRRKLDENKPSFRLSNLEKNKIDKGRVKVIDENIVAEKRSLSVFLCHAHSDSVAVKNIHLRLVKDGVDAWLDKKKLIPGADWEHEIRKAVRDADAVLVCHSKDFNQRGFRQKEVRFALDVAMEQPEGELFIIPARLEECEILESLKKWHQVDLYKRGGYSKLIQALRVRAEKVGASLK
ncbi:MAG TPA: TIR domain-containing protein [Anaerolineales bacterium]|nr:TIR domain-containing protein [Anaerolineales bacterium]